MKLIVRPQYIERLKALKNTPDIKVITGIRRSGKSWLLLEFIDFLRETEADCNIIYIDYTRLDNEDLREYHALNDYVINHISVQ